MTLFRICLIIFLFAFLSPLSGSATDQSAEIIQSFATYKEAIFDDNGELAWSLVDKNTQEYYDKITRMAIYADKPSILALKTWDQVMVLEMRHKIPHELLINMNGKDYFKYLVKKNVIGGDWMYEKLSLGKIETDGHFAKAEIRYRGGTTRYYFHFNFENGSWKPDIQYLYNHWGYTILPGLEKENKWDEKSRQDFILHSLGSDKKPVDPSTIYLPLK